MKLSVVVPCYNEENNIPLILERFGKLIKREDIEVILVNNGSTDNSAVVLEELLPRYPFRSRNNRRQSATKRIVKMIAQIALK